MENGIKELTNEIKGWRDGQERQMAKIEKILLGNGEVGLCETVRALVKTSVALWYVVGSVGLALLGSIATLMVRGGAPK
jgi:hypothetical protein